MYEKTFAKPMMDMVEYHMSQISCSSLRQVNVGDTGLNYGGGGNDPTRGKRGILD